MLIWALICALSSLLPLGVSGVALQTGQLAEGTPPLDIIPGFQAVVRLAGSAYVPPLLPPPEDAAVTWIEKAGSDAL